MKNYESINFKNKLNLLKQTWVKRYALHPNQIRQLMLRAKLQSNDIRLLNGTVLTSYQMNDLLSHHQYKVGELVSTTTTSLEANKERLSYLLSQLNSTIFTRKGLDASISELEVQKRQHYSYVHHNKFVRAQDMHQDTFITSVVNNRFIQNSLNYIYDYGLSLPIKKSHLILVKDVMLNYSDTSIGDTVPISIDSPRNLIEGEIFNYKIRRLCKDERDQKIKRVPMKLGLDFFLYGSQRVNWIEIRSASPQSLTIDSIASIAANGEKTIFTSEVFVFKDRLIVQLEPIAANKIEIVFSSKSYTSLMDEDQKIYEDYDLSLLDIKLMYNVFNETGYYASKDIDMKFPVSFKLDCTVSNPQVVNLTIDYGDKFSLAANVGFVEAQLELYNDSTRVILPIPISRTSTQLLRLNNQHSKLQFLPDIYTSSKKYFCSYVDQNSFTTDITLYFNHGLEVGATFNQDAELFLGIERDNILTHKWDVIDEKTIRLYHGLASVVSFTGQSNPSAVFVVYDYKGFTVNQGYSSLVIGKDYRLSLDSGKTWYTAMPSYLDIKKTYETSTAGNCLIDILSKSIGSTYWVQYTIENEQQVLPNSLAIIKHDKIVLDSKLRLSNCKGNVRLILDSDKILPELSPVITQYELKVRSHENSRKALRKDTVTRK